MEHSKYFLFHMKTYLIAVGVYIVEVAAEALRRNMPIYPMLSYGSESTLCNVIDAAIREHFKA
ncbi:hypothetical protein STFR1_20545 [Bacillus vallismortis]